MSTVPVGADDLFQWLPEFRFFEEHTFRVAYWNHGNYVQVLWNLQESLDCLVIE